MNYIAAFVAFISCSLLWNTEFQNLKWLIIISVILNFTFRQKSGDYSPDDDPRAASFSAHASVITFWISIVLSLTGIIKVILLRI